MRVKIRVENLAEKVAELRLLTGRVHWQHLNATACVGKTRKDALLQAMDGHELQSCRDTTRHSFLL